MQPWLDFETCFEVDDEHIEPALAPAVSIEDELPRARVLALLDRMAEVARPKQGGPRVLLVLARLAACDWLEGTLEVTLRPNGTGSTIDLMVDDGLVRSRLRPPLCMAVPFPEMEQGALRMEQLIVPLAVSGHVPAKRVELTVRYGASGSDVALDVLEGRPTLRPPAEIAAIGVHRLARRSEPPKKKTRSKRPTISQYPQDPMLGHAVVAPPKSTSRMKQAAAESEATRAVAGVKRSPEPSPRPTVKMEAVSIPKGALKRSKPPVVIETKEPSAAHKGEPAARKGGWGRPPIARPTIKMEAVRIPEEAYRDTPEPAPTDEKPTVKPAAPVSQPGLDEGSPKTDDIDSDW